MLISRHRFVQGVGRALASAVILGMIGTMSRTERSGQGNQADSDFVAAVPANLGSA